MRVLVITFRGQEHHATETDEYSSRGNPFIVCNCGATAYGLNGIIHAHNRGDQRHPVRVMAEPEKRTGWKRVWDPEWDDAQGKREYMSRSLDRKGRPAWWVHMMERAFCRWYGHTPSADPAVCVYCQQRRTGKRDGRWNPAPKPEPTERVLPPRGPRTVRYPPLSTVYGPPPIPLPSRPAIEPPRKRYRHQEEEHPDTPAEDCWLCMGPPKGWRDVPEPPGPPCWSHQRPNCPICARKKT